MTVEIRKLSFVENIALHIIPGILMAGFTFIFSYLFSGRHVPALLFLQISLFVVLLPWVLLTMLHYKKKENVNSLKELIGYTNTIKWYEYIIYSLLILVFAGLVLTIFGKTIHSGIKKSLFCWLPPWMDVTDALINKSNYSQGIIIFIWYFGIITTGIFGPLLEEIYFRGFLLPRIKGNETYKIIVGAVLFALYHVFSLWMVPGRIIALLPLIYLVVKKKNLKLAIYAHCLLNIVGDTLSSIPIVFK